MGSSDRPLGWRKRIGVMSPTVMETANHDFFRVAPDGVTMCAITSNVEHWDRENFKGESVIESAYYPVPISASRDVDYIMHCGMPVVTTRGKGLRKRLSRSLLTQLIFRFDQHPLSNPSARHGRP